MSPETRSTASRDERLLDIVESYLAQHAAGAAESPEDVLARHPEFATELTDFFRARAQVDGVVVPLREAIQAEPQTVEQAASLLHTHRELGDFSILREVGRGGMGIVYEAEQLSLGRRVALKVLPFAATMDPRHLQRFKNEAHAAAQLHHTNIVPVHYVGCERGVHFYAMQFIEGNSLAEVVAQLREKENKISRKAAKNAKEDLNATADFAPSRLCVSSGSPADSAGQTTKPIAALSTIRSTTDSTYYRMVAELGIQAAEALDYAHENGIIHRDIKPANLLLDAAGRVWVTDFGLAQVQGDARMTMTGDLVGTLRYMSPEQALAKRVVVDHRTDIYSLGASLYELLTFEPAFTGTDRQELLRQIAFEEPRPPRRVRKSIPSELEIIVLKAIEKNPAERYATAKEVAEDLRRYLYHEPIRARRPSLVQFLKKWGRRHKAAIVAAAVCLLVSTAAISGSVGWALGNQRARQRQAESIVFESLEAAAPYLRAGNPYDPDLLAAVERAEAQARNEMLGVELFSQVKQLRRDVVMLSQLEQARLLSSDPNTDKEFDYGGANGVYAKVFAEYGVDMATLGPQRAAELIRGSALRSHLVAALYDWTFVSGKIGAISADRLRMTADLADDETWRIRLQQAMTHGDIDSLKELAKHKGTLQQSAANVELLARSLIQFRDWETAENLLRAVHEANLADFWINFQLANTLQHRTPPRLAEAARFYQAAIALRPRSAVVLNNLGIVLCDLGMLEEAERNFRKALALQPDLPHLHNGLANVLRQQGRLEEAEAALGKATALKPDFGPAYINLGAVLALQHKLRDAEHAFQKAIQLDCALDMALTGLGNIYQEQGKFAEAEIAYRKAIEIKPQFALAYYRLGDALCNQGEFREALTFYKRAHELVTRNPAVPDFTEPLMAQCERCARLLQLDAKLPNILRGGAEPDAVGERLELARMCQLYKKFNFAAVRFYREAFTKQPQLADNLQTQDRYNAACAAALASCGQGNDAGNLDDKERTRLRKQSLEWLRADMKAWTGLLDKELDKIRPTVAKTMQHWLGDADFNGVRGAEALAKLPEAERKDWQELWQEVEALHKRAAGKAEPAAARPELVPPPKEVVSD
jgi:serine/threonine protein kinase/Tfp pilus assembly protein PilF